MDDAVSSYILTFSLHTRPHLSSCRLLHTLRTDALDIFLRRVTSWRKISHTSSLRRGLWSLLAIFLLKRKTEAPWVKMTTNMSHHLINLAFDFILLQIHVHSFYRTWILKQKLEIIQLLIEWMIEWKSISFLSLFSGGCSFSGTRRGWKSVQPRRVPLRL